MVCLELLRQPSLAPRLAVDKYGGDLGLDLQQQTTLNSKQVQLEVEPAATIPFWFSRASAENMYRIAAVTGRTRLPPPERLIDLTVLEDAWRSLHPNPTPPETQPSS